MAETFGELPVNSSIVFSRCFYDCKKSSGTPSEIFESV